MKGVLPIMVDHTIISPLTRSVITRYLFIMGVLSTFGIALALIWFVAYVINLALLSVAALVHTFSLFSPVVQLLLLALFAVLVLWRLSSHMKRVAYGH